MSTTTGGNTRTRKNPAKRTVNPKGLPENERMLVSGAWKDPFFRVPNELVDYPEEHPPLTTLEKLVYVVLLRYANSDGQAWPRYSKIAEAASCSRASAIRAISGLCSSGLVLKTPVIIEGIQHSNHYVVFLPSHLRAAREEVLAGALTQDVGGLTVIPPTSDGEKNGGGSQDDTGGSHCDTPGYQNETLIEEEEKGTEQRKKKALSASTGTEERKAKAKALPAEVRASLERLYERMKEEGRQSTLDDVLKPEQTE